MNNKRITSTFTFFVNVIRRDPKVRIETDDMLDRYNRLLPEYQSKIGYVTLIKNVILEESMNRMSSRLTDLEIELKMKISRIKFLESKKLI